MKKRMFYLLLLLGLFLPLNVFAALPESGVTYFFMYPNGLETASENYEDAINPREELLYSATTDSHGQVVLNGLGDEGEVRIVSKDRDGEREVTVNLANQSSAEVVKTNYLINPKTGESILLVIEVLAVLLGFYLLVFRQKKKGLLLFVLVAFTFALFNVHADQEDFVITVKDDDGNALANTLVEVYAKPVKVEAHPAIKLALRGGTFLDGTEEMYVRLPYDGCSVDDMYDYNYENYLESALNIENVKKNGYFPDGYDFSDTLFNGDVFHMTWYQSDNNYMTVDLNGGVVYFRGKEFTKLTSSYVSPDTIQYISSKIISGSSYLVGFDNSKRCSNYDEHGIYNPSEMLDGMNEYVYYACWNDYPDGIYVNDYVFVGNSDTCYFQSHSHNGCDFYGLYNEFLGSYFEVYFDGPSVAFSPISYDLSLDQTTEGEVAYAFPNINSSTDYAFSYNSISSSWRPTYEYVNYFEIIDDGESIVSLDSNDFEFDRSSGYYSVTNSVKNEKLMEYFYHLWDKGCTYSCGVVH